MAYFQQQTLRFTEPWSFFQRLKHVSLRGGISSLMQQSREPIVRLGWIGRVEQQ